MLLAVTRFIQLKFTFALHLMFRGKIQFSAPKKGDGTNEKVQKMVNHSIHDYKGYTKYIIAEPRKVEHGKVEPRKIPEV